jgi:hypothetical protein
MNQAEETATKAVKEDKEADLQQLANEPIPHGG